MSILIRHYLKDYFKLPGNFIRPDANLNMLAILSLYFDEPRRTEHRLIPAEIDPEKLSIEIKELESDTLENKFFIRLDKLLKDPGNRQATYTDHIGRDGLCEFHLHLFLAIMEMPGQISKGPGNMALLENALTVEDLIMAYETGT